MGKNISLFGSTFKSIMWSTRSSCWSLKTQWGAIKHDITKSVYCYDSMLSLNELGTSLEDVLQKALEPTSTQRLIFCMHSFWLFFKDIPRWVDIETKLKKNLLMKLKMPMTSTMERYLKNVKSWNPSMVVRRGTPQVPTRKLMWMNTITQRHWRIVCAFKAKVIMDMVTTTLKKIEDSWRLVGFNGFQLAWKCFEFNRGATMLTTISPIGACKNFNVN